MFTCIHACMFGSTVLCGDPITYALNKITLHFLECNLYINSPITAAVCVSVAGGPASVDTQTETIMYCNHTIVPYSYYRHTLWSTMINQMPQTGREGSMSLIESDIKQYQMANQHSERLDVTVGTLQDSAVMILLYLNSFLLAEPFKPKTLQKQRRLCEQNAIWIMLAVRAMLSLSYTHPRRNTCMKFHTSVSS